LALGMLAVVGYGLSERLLPSVLDFDSSESAGGRLEQPVTYWNAMGALAAFGLVLCTRLAGSPDRRAPLRALATAAVPPLAAGLYLSFSRGALAALAAGLIVLLALASDRAQARAVAVGAVAGAPAMVLAGVLPDVKRVDADGAGDGAVLLAGLLLLTLAAGAVQLLLARRERAGPLSTGRLDPRGIRAAAAALGVGLVAAAVLAAGSGDAGRGAVAGAEGARLRSLESSRYDYWEVAASSFADRPLAGVGTAGFRAEWERRRDLPESARDAHSLYLETAAELGLVGLALLGLFLAGVALAARAAYRLAPAAGAGPAAVLAAWALHAGFDWDWEMPAVTLPVLALAGLVVGLSESDVESRRAFHQPWNRSMPAAASTSSESSAA
jgi:O-antigen ligase